MHKRLIAARILVVLGALLAALAAIAGYVRYQVFDDDTFRGTAEELVADPLIRAEVGASLVDQLYANVDVAARLEARLPEDQKGLAEPLAGSIRALAESQAGRLLGRPRIQALWVNALATTQQRLERVLDGDETVLDTQDGWLVINTKPLVVQLGEQVAVFGRVADALSDEQTVIRVYETDKLAAAQDATALFKFVAAWLWVLPLAMWALAIWLARGRRREEVRAVAISIVCAGVLVLLIRSVAGRYIVDAVAAETGQETAEQAWSILTSLLADGGRTLVGIGLVALAGVWLVGPATRAVWVRHKVAPYLQRPEYAFGAGAAALVLLAWWGPTEQTRRVGWILVVGALLALGIEALRIVTAREEEEEAPAPPPAHEPA